MKIPSETYLYSKVRDVNQTFKHGPILERNIIIMIQTLEKDDQELNVSSCLRGLDSTI